MHGKRWLFWKKISQIAVYVLATLAVFLSIAPIVYLALTSFKEPELTFAIPPVWNFAPTSENYQEVLSSTNFDKYFLNSFVTAISTTAIALVLGTLAAYGFSRFRFRGDFWLRMSSLIPQMLPPIAIVVPLYVLFSRLDWIDTRQSLIISYLTFTVPLSIWMMIGFFDDVPVELEEAAVVDGCGPWKIFFTVILPLIKPGLAAAAIFTFRIAWNEFILALVLTNRITRTLPVATTIYLTDAGVEWGNITAMGTLVALPAIIFTFLAAKQLIAGLTAGAVKG